MGITWEEAEVTAHNRSEWRWSAITGRYWKLFPLSLGNITNANLQRLKCIWVTVLIFLGHVTAPLTPICYLELFGRY